jgi:hypothetical protein
VKYYMTQEYFDWHKWRYGFEPMTCDVGDELTVIDAERIGTSFETPRGVIFIYGAQIELLKQAQS